MSWFDSLLWPIMIAVAWIMTTFHSLFSAIGLDEPFTALQAAGGALVVGGVLLVSLRPRTIARTQR